MNLFWNSHTRSFVLRLFSLLPIRRGRLMCICWGGTQYNCNPRAIVEKMADMGLTNGKSRQFEVYFAFLDPQKFQKELPVGVNAVALGGCDYFRLLSTSQFIISNTRFGGGIFWPMSKRKGQVYIMTNHGGHGIKKIEHDAVLSSNYMKVADEDTNRIDLVFSDSTFLTKVRRSAYQYSGEVLECGVPRNDVFFKQQSSLDEKRYLIYAPTFRNNGRRDVYGFPLPFSAERQMYF